MTNLDREDSRHQLCSRHHRWALRHQTHDLSFRRRQ
jgi:hypothetical protein